MIIRILISWALVWGAVAHFPFNAGAQEINFGQYGSYSLYVAELTGEDLDFGQVAANSGINSIGLTNAKTLSLTGVKYLDVLVDISAGPELLLNGNPGNAGDPQRSIPFTLEAAYANKGQNSLADAKIINVVSNSAFVQFQVLERESGAPGPPPTPPHEGYDPALYEETAYIYLYGSINVGNVNAGSYSNTITVSINYD